MLSEWLTRLRFLFFRKAPGDLDAELAFHLEEQARANEAAGMDAAEARRQAGIAFGGVQRARGQSYAARPGYRLEMLGQDVRYALRGFRRNPVLTLAVVVTLMLGISATTAVFSVVDRILFRALPYGHADRLVSLGIVHSLETQEFVMGNFYSDWRANQKPFEAVTSESTGPWECDLTERSPAQLSCEAVEGNLLPTFGVAPILGRNFLQEESRVGGPNVALITYGMWLNRFGLDKGILNQTINIDGQPVRVVGVLPRDFEMPRLESADVLRPFQVDPIADHKANGGYGSPRRIFALLKPGVTVEQARQEMEPLFQESLKQVPADIRQQMHPAGQADAGCALDGVGVVWRGAGGAADRLCQCSEFADGARRGAETGAGGAFGAGRQPCAAYGTGDDRSAAAGNERRLRWMPAGRGVASAVCVDCAAGHSLPKPGASGSAHGRLHRAGLGDLRAAVWIGSCAREAERGDTGGTIGEPGGQCYECFGAAVASSCADRGEPGAADWGDAAGAELLEDGA